MIEFKRVGRFDRGLIYKLLCESYASLLELEADYRHEFIANWQKTDDDLFNGLNSSGSAVIIPFRRLRGIAPCRSDLRIAISIRAICQ